MDIRSLISKAPKNSELSRRAMLRAAGCGFGYMGLQSLLAETALAPAWTELLRLCLQVEPAPQFVGFTGNARGRTSV